MHGHVYVILDEKRFFILPKLHDIVSFIKFIFINIFIAYTILCHWLCWHIIVKDLGSTQYNKLF